MTDCMVEFKIGTGETVYMRVSAMMCLFPNHHQIRTIEHGWTEASDQEELFSDEEDTESLADELDVEIPSAE